MNKLIQRLCYLLILMSIIFIQCGEDSTIAPTPTPEPVVLPIATITHNVPSMTTEGEQSYSITVTLDKAATTTLSIPITANGGTATAGSDYTIPANITINAGQTSGNGTLTIASDCENEAVETFTVRVGNSAATDVTITPLSISSSIENASGDELTMTFDWSGSVQFQGQTLAFCDYVDIDIVIADTSFSLLGINGASTLDCPEVLHLTPDSLDNGLYFIFSILYFNGFDSTFTHKLPITVQAVKCGGFDVTFVQNDIYQYDAGSKDFANDMETTDIFAPVVGLFVEDGIYTLLDFESADVIIEGIKQKLQDPIMQRKLRSDLRIR